MDVLTTAWAPMFGLRGGKTFASDAHLSSMSGFLDPTNPGIRARQMNKTTAHLPWPGAVLEADGETWYGKTYSTAYLAVLDEKGNVPNAPKLIQDIIGTEQDYCPSNLYTCEMCHGSGQSPLFSPDMHNELVKNEFNGRPFGPDKTYPYPTPMKCTVCNGRGTPPIPWGEVK